VITKEAATVPPRQVEQAQLQALDDAEDSLGRGGEDDLLDRRVEGGEVDGQARLRRSRRRSCSPSCRTAPDGWAGCPRCTKSSGERTLPEAPTSRAEASTSGAPGSGVPGEHRPEGRLRGGRGWRPWKAGSCLPMLAPRLIAAFNALLTMVSVLRAFLAKLGSSALKAEPHAWSRRYAA
jgi:hypothetical protein